MVKTLKKLNTIFNILSQINYINSEKRNIRKNKISQYMDLKIIKKNKL